VFHSRSESQTQSYNANPTDVEVLWNKSHPFLSLGFSFYISMNPLLYL
jgi:hypothetical protein